MLSFNYNSSVVDWCETNYDTLSFVCEFMNAITSITYTIHAYYHYHHYTPLISISNKKQMWKLIFLNNMALGISSFLFHATLSEFGQFLDEACIVIWMYMTAYILNVLDFFICLPIFVFIFYPYFTRFSLFIVCGMYLIKSYPNLQKTPSIQRTTKCAFIQFSFAILCWLIDFILCPILPCSLHWVWHIYGALAQHNLITSMIASSNIYDLCLNFSYPFYVIVSKTQLISLEENQSLLSDNSDDDDNDNDDFVYLS